MAGQLPPGVNPAQIPLASPPPGVIPNLVDPYTEAPRLGAVIYLLYSIQVLVVTARIWIRSRITRNLGWDDFFAAAATVLISAEVGLTAGLFEIFIGRHIWDVPLSTVLSPQWSQLLETVQILTPLINLTVKLTVLTLLLRVFPYKFQPTTATFAYIGIAAVSIFNLACFILSMYACIPRPGTHGMLPASCSTEALGEKIILAGNCFNMVIDLYIFVFPLPAIWRLNLSKKRRIGIVLILATGLAILTLAFRIAWKDYFDQTLYQGRLAAVNNAEISIGVITACLPCLATMWAYIGEVRSMSGLSSASKIRCILTGSRGYVLSQDRSRHGSGDRSELKSNRTHSDAEEINPSHDGTKSIMKTSMTVVNISSAHDVYELNERRVEAQGF